MSKRAHITIKTFNAVKILLEGGASIKEAADFMGISEMSAKRIKASKDFDEYKSRSSGSYYIAKRKAMEKAEKEKKQEEKPAKVTYRFSYKFCVVHDSLLVSIRYRSLRY